VALPAVSGVRAMASKGVLTEPLMKERRDAPTASERERAGARGRVALGATLCMALALAFAPVGAGRTVERRPAPVTVSVDGTHPGAPVPRDFLGLSFEASALAQIASYADGGDLVTMLRSLGLGVLRFGGVTSDYRVAWTDEAIGRPPGRRQCWKPGICANSVFWQPRAVCAAARQGADRGAPASNDHQRAGPAKP